MQYEDEEAFELAVLPKRAHFAAESGGASRHLMVNGSSERIAIKVKCSNNNLFRIAPVYTVLEPGCAQRLQVVRDPGAPGTDKLVLLYTPTTSRNPREVFAQTEKSELKRFLIVLVSKCRHHRQQQHPGTATHPDGIIDADDDDEARIAAADNEVPKCECERISRGGGGEQLHGADKMDEKNNDVVRTNSPGKASSSAGTATALTDPHDIIALIDDLDMDEDEHWGGKSMKQHQQQALRAAVAAASRKF